MNCGCYGNEISKLVISVDAVTFDGQLKTFNNSYDEKIKFGKLVYSKNLKNKP